MSAFPDQCGQQRTSDHGSGEHRAGVVAELAAPVGRLLHPRLQLFEIRLQHVARLGDVGRYLVSSLAHSTFSLRVAVVLGAARTRLNLLIPSPTHSAAIRPTPAPTISAAIHS